MEDRAIAVYKKRLGVFVRVPEPGQVKTRLCPPLSSEEACRLYTSFVRDLFSRLERLKKVRGTVFYAGGDAAGLAGLIPERFERRPQRGKTLGGRLQAAFDDLLAEGDGPAVVIGSDSPDLPVRFVKRAFLKLKHKDVALGPAADGGYYLVGLRSPAGGIFEGVSWGGSAVLEQTIERVEAHGLTLSLLPLWYDVDTPASLELLRTLMRARRVERSGRLEATEAVLDEIAGSADARRL